VYETVNANSLSSFVKEQMEENGGEVPAWLSGKVNVFEKTTVSVRKSQNSNGGKSHVHPIRNRSGGQQYGL
jgi:hypothetical protein